MIPKISQETLAEMIGTTRSRGSFFLNKFSRLLARVGLVHERHFHRIACDFLDVFGQCRHLRAILLVGRRHQQGQQVPERIHRQVNFRAASAFGWIKTCSPAALWRRLNRTAIENRGRGLGCSTRIFNENSHIRLFKP